ncbi:unnamed protein product [Euphydryas editha]|uniref:Uncharacterized protein n=1 Tax=Euphydryas editha TaxID=104508 RepID=A0AAU9TLZ8_EUPED|nr:unnamed protein product [Euphydryas editha]
MSLSAPAQAVRGTRTNSLDQLDFQERRQLIASSLSLTDFLHVGAKEVAAVAGSREVSTVAFDELACNSVNKKELFCATTTSTTSY